MGNIECLCDANITRCDANITRCDANNITSKNTKSAMGVLEHKWRASLMLGNIKLSIVTMF